jgi:hypothetical protein
LFPSTTNKMPKSLEAVHALLTNAGMAIPAIGCALPKTVTFWKETWTRENRRAVSSSLVEQSRAGTWQVSCVCLRELYMLLGGWLGGLSIGLSHPHRSSGLNTNAWSPKQHHSRACILLMLVSRRDTRMRSVSLARMWCVASHLRVGCIICSISHRLHPTASHRKLAPRRLRQLTTCGCLPRPTSF